MSTPTTACDREEHGRSPVITIEIRLTRIGQPDSWIGAHTVDSEAGIGQWLWDQGDLLEGPYHVYPNDDEDFRYAVMTDGRVYRYPTTTK